MSLDDVPKYVRYDFFMAILGIFIIYFTFSNENVYKIEPLRWALFIFGVVLSVYGIAEMSSTYYSEKKIQKISNKIELANVKKELNSLPKDFVEKEDISLKEFFKKHKKYVLFTTIIIIVVLISFIIYLNWII